MTSAEAAREIGRLAQRMVELAPHAGLYVGVSISPAKPKVADEALTADAAAGLSLRTIAAKHGVGVGRVRGAILRWEGKK